MAADPAALIGGLKLDLSEKQAGQLAALLLLLARDEHAPTAVRDLAAARDAHFADSLAALEVEQVLAARAIADVGSGAGFPGLPLAVALPRARVYLVESQLRECEFLARATAAGRVGNAHVVCARVEEWHEGARANDVVLARALAPQPVVLEYAAPLLRMGGALVDWRGRRRSEEEARAAGAASQLGLELSEIRRVRPFAEARERHLHVFVKVAETPRRFPRRTGVARKRPLGDAPSDRGRG
jgi:16S rRNA (guanine527-N7)-methyltransferase